VPLFHGFTWSDAGRPTTVWMNPMVPLQFVFEGNRRPKLSRDWLEALSETANSVAGLQTVPEIDVDAVLPPDVKGLPPAE